MIANTVYSEGGCLAELQLWDQNGREHGRVLGRMLPILMCASGQSNCHGLQGTCQEENKRIEEFFDNMRKRVDAILAQQEGTEKRFENADLPWDKQALRRVRIASLNLSTLSMSK